MAHRIASGIAPQLKSARPHRTRRPRELQARLKDADHLRLISALPCLISGRAPAGVAAHIRYANAQFGKEITGISIKPDDRWSVPLCAWFHTDSSGAQHRHGEEGWWIDQGLEPLKIAFALYECSVALRADRMDEETIIRVLALIVHNVREGQR